MIRFLEICGASQSIPPSARAPSHQLWANHRLPEQQVEQQHSDYSLRCVRLTAINLALRNLYGYVIHGNSLGDERRLVYRTGFDLVGVISEVPIEHSPEPVQKIVAEHTSPVDSPAALTSPDESCGSKGEAHDEPTRRTNQLRLF